MRTNLIVVDDFFDDAEAVRRRALAGPFVESTAGGYTGSFHTPRRFDVGPILSGLARSIGADVAYDPGLPFSFRSLTKAQQARKDSIVHHDRSLWVAFVCLTAPSLPLVFTKFYRHRETGLSGVHDAARVRALLRQRGGSLEALGERFGKDSKRMARWTEIGRVAHLFNRLIVMRGRQFHAAAPGFGTEPANAKLTLLVPFEVVGDEQRKRTARTLRTRLFQRLASTKSE